MALLNFMTSGTYSVVESVSYTKSVKVIQAKLVVYSDATKTEVVASKDLFFGGVQQPGIKSVVLTEPPENPEVGDSWITALSGCTGIWENQDGLLCTYLGPDHWSYSTITPWNHFFDEVREKYFCIKNGQHEDVDEYNDIRLWDRYFALQTEDNLVKQIYDFLKVEISLFSTCVDA